MTPRSRPVPMLTALLAALMLGALCPARAQQVDLSEDTITAISLNGPQRQAVREFVAEHRVRFQSEDPAEVKRARNALLRPFDNPRISVSFRNAYSDELLPILNAMAGRPGDLATVNALVVAGSLATQQGAGLVERFRADKNRVAIRYAALSAYRRTFEAMAASSPAIADRDAAGMVDRLGQHLLDEQDPLVFDACVRALLAASEVRRPGFESVWHRAMSALASGLSVRLPRFPTGPAGEEFIGPAMRAAAALRDVAAAGPRLELPQEVSRRMVEMAADLWAWVARGLAAGAFPVAVPGNDEAAVKARREFAAQAADISQSLLYFAAERIKRDPWPAQEAVGGWIREASKTGDDRFVRRVRDVVGPGGLLTKPPFGFADNRFLR